MTPDRLQALFEQGVREGVQLWQRPDGSVYATSAEDGRSRYEVSGTGCSCPAGQHGQPCKHLALYLSRQAFHGWLDRQPPAPVNLAEWRAA